jgi:hypothetical protein
MKSSSSSSFSTYEATKAAERVLGQPDPIHWHGAAAFRDSSYRQLHHQRGMTGVFNVRLLEAADLQRSYWSALALGPVKHLGLSKAHGAVSSFCTFTLDFQDVHDCCDDDVRKRPYSLDADLKPAAKNTKNKPSVVSPVVPEDNNPVWDSCHFEFPLKKGACPDGARVLLCVSVQEEATAVENLLPTAVAGGGAGNRRLLGLGKLDLTELCLGETATGQPLPGVRDAWITLSLEGQQHDERVPDLTKDDPLAPPVKLEASMTKSTGKVRVLVSYQPVGMEPQPKDVVALEAFARRNGTTTSCRPVLDPLMPLFVLDRRGSYILAEYLLTDGRKACVRLHRNAVFVIERQNIVDAATNLALLPVDVALSTPVGQAVQHALQPVVTAGSELLMPALLSVKLVWMAARTTGLGVVSGVHALAGTVWHEGATSLTRGSGSDPSQQQRAAALQYHRNNSHRDNRAATAQFVQL